MLVFFVEVVFIASMCIDLYTLVDVGTSESGIIPKSSMKVNTDYKYFIQPLKSNAEMIELKVCRTCHIVRPPRSFHCKKCNACIEVQDHHCPWTGTCIGRRTHKKFIIFLLATFNHGVVAGTLGYWPLKWKWHKGITDLYVFSSVILMAYSIIILTLMFGFSLFHLSLAFGNITTNEKLRGAYKVKTNCWDEGSSKNWELFSDLYPSTPSNIFDNFKSLVEDEENYYHAILKRYGKLV